MRVLLVSVLLLLAACATDPGLQLDSPTNDDTAALHFSVEPCDHDLDPYTPPQAGILSQTWRGSTLVVEGFVKTYCHGATIRGDYSVEGERLILRYTLRIDSVVTKCRCVHRVVYELSGLEKKDYEVTLVPET